MIFTQPIQFQNLKSYLKELNNFVTFFGKKITKNLLKKFFNSLKRLKFSNK